MGFARLPKLWRHAFPRGRRLFMKRHRSISRLAATATAPHITRASLRQLQPEAGARRAGEAAEGLVASHTPAKFLSIAMLFALCSSKLAVNDCHTELLDHLSR